MIFVRTDEVITSTDMWLLVNAKIGSKSPNSVKAPNSVKSPNSGKSPNSCKSPNSGKSPNSYSRPSDTIANNGRQNSEFSARIQISISVLLLPACDYRLVFDLDEICAWASYLNLRRIFQIIHRITFFLCI